MNVSKSQKKGKQTSGARAPVQAAQRGLSNASRSARLEGAKQLSEQYKLSPCAKHYVDSLVNPFDGEPGACIPMLPNCPSSKKRYWARGVFSTGTNSAGWIVGRPYMANDSWVAAATNSSYTGTASTQLNTSTFGGGVTSYNCNSEFNGPAFEAPGNGVSGASAVAGRVVSWGLRIRYRGTELNRGGTVTLFEEPEHLDITNNNSSGGGMSLATMLAYENVQTHPIPSDGSWLYLTGLPVYPWEFDYDDTSLGYDFSSSSVGGYPPAYLCAFVESAAASQPFDFEVFLNLELIGGGVRGKTPSHFDAMGAQVGLEAVRTQTISAGKSKENAPARSSNRSFLQGLSDFALSTLSGVASKLPIVGPVMKLLA